MIVRTSEAHIREGQRDQFMRTLRDLVETFPRQYAGFVSHEILVDQDEPDRVVYRSVWRDRDSVAGFAGDEWQVTPVTFPGEAELLREPLHLRHFEVVEVDDDGEQFTPEE
jgi:heme-degrading monooxygenase HmoA